MVLIASLISIIALISDTVRQAIETTLNGADYDTSNECLSKVRIFQQMTYPSLVGDMFYFEATPLDKNGEDFEVVFSTDSTRPNK